MDMFEVEFYMDGRYYTIEVTSDYAASSLISSLEDRMILVTSLRKNGVPA